MSILTELEINKVCRTCLIRSDDMKPLYETCSREIDVSLAEMLTSFTSLKCFNDDGLPKQMCYNCMGELNRFYIFQLKCVKSDELLRRFIQKTIKIEGHVNINGNCQQIDDAAPKDINNYEFANVKVEIIDEPYPDCQSSVNRVEIADCDSIKSLRDPLTTAELQNDQKLDLFINDVSVKTESDDAVNSNCELNTPVNSVELSKNVVKSSNQAIQNGGKRFLCSNCDKSYKLKAHLTIHMRQHTGEKPYSCKLCDKSFYRKTQLNRHIPTHSREKPFSCTICDSSFYHKDYLSKHMQTHTEAKPYACTLCTVSFSRKEHLKRHMQTHTGEKPFVCSVCACTFQRKHILKIHMRTHTGEKPYTCTQCDSAFIRKAHLTRHMQTHTREKPYECTMCERSFQRKELLTIHMRKHTGEKPYACTVCDSSFHRKQILTVHMRNHTGEKPFSCTICASTFKQKSHLTFHMWKHN